MFIGIVVGMNGLEKKIVAMMSFVLPKESNPSI
jgi:hypothetical protein